MLKKGCKNKNAKTDKLNKAKEILNSELHMKSDVFF